MRITLLFILCSFVWGSTWFAITLQLGEVDPLWSICYRFFLASAIMAIVCHCRKQFVRYSFQQHCRLFMQGSCLCGLSYWLVYLSETYITSALSALMCTSVLYLNVVIGWLWLGNPLRIPVIIGGVIGSAGIVMIFAPDLQEGTSGTNLAYGLGLAFTACILFSIGSVTCEKNEQDGMELIPVVTYNMLYGGVLVSAIALLKGIPPGFVLSVEYIGSLLYLVFFGSVAAMTSYVALIRRIGADRTAYIDIIYPVIALLISTLFEGYQWTLLSVTGVMIILVGNWVALGTYPKQLLARGKKT